MDCKSVRFLKSVNEYRCFQNGGNNLVTGILIHHPFHRLYTALGHIFTSGFMLYTNLAFFTQLPGYCEQVFVKKKGAIFLVKWQCQQNGLLPVSGLNKALAGSGNGSGAHRLFRTFSAC